MVEFLISDGTQRPSFTDNVFYVKSNKKFVIKKGDFEEYKLGIRFDFDSNEEYIELHPSSNNVDKFVLNDGILLQPNYNQERQTIVILINKTCEDIYINKYDDIIVGYVKKINNSAVEPVVETPAPVAETPAPAAEPVVETPAPVAETPAPVAETPAPAAEPVVETPAPVAEPVVETPAPVVEPVVESVVETPAPVVEPVAETPAPVVESVVETPAPAVVNNEEDGKPKRKYVRKKAI